jgi:Uma2 family endonuclease
MTISTSQPVSTEQSIVSEPIQDAPKDVIFPPGDLWSDEPPLESDLHRDQIDLLIRLLRWYWRDRQDVYVSGNLTVYYFYPENPSKRFRGPDFFVALGTENRPRRSWMVWEEQGKYPNVIVELLSDSTAKTDRGLKKDLYQDTFRTPDYFWFHPDTLEFQGFHLVDGHYQPIQPNDQGWLWSQQLDLYLGVHERKLRFFTQDGEMLPTPEEAAQTERQRAEAADQQVGVERQRTEEERQRAEEERQRNARLREKLRELGIDPDTVS